VAHTSVESNSLDERLMRGDTRFIARRSRFMQNDSGGRMATLAQLESQIQKLQRRAEALREKKSVEVIARIQALMKEYGLTTADLAVAGLGTGKKRGRPFGSKNVSAAKKGHAKGKLPPKYRDPQSGATWSGHARPPAWIKDAPDRSVFLIDGATGTSSGSTVAKKGARRGRVASASRAASAERTGRAASKTSAKQVSRKAAKKGARKNAQSAAA
jgi:DNA-binding protein H-NS